MINSLLEKPYKKVVIDRLLVDEREVKELFNEPKKVLKRIADYFQKQFKKRSFQQKRFSNSWKEIYKPIMRINNDCYKELNSKITKEE